MAGAEEIRIETWSASGDVHRTIIWVVTDGEDLFIRSVNGEGARWYREAISGRPTGIAFDRKGPAIPVALSPAADPESIERCSAALRAKYAADPALASMLKPHTLPTTLRVLAGT